MPWPPGSRLLVDRQRLKRGCETAFLPGDIVRNKSIGIDKWVLAFTLAVSVITGVFSALDFSIDALINLHSLKIIFIKKNELAIFMNNPIFQSGDSH